MIHHYSITSMTLNDVKVYAGLGNDHEPFASFRDLSWNNFNGDVGPAIALKGRCRVDKYIIK